MKGRRTMGIRLSSGALAAMMIAAGITVSAQTNTFPSTGNVGIGTTSPVWPLDVNGVINARQQGVENNLAYQINGNGSWAQTNLIGHWWTGSQDAISLQVPANTTNAAQMVMLANGNVGVGTTTPAGELHIARSASGTIGPSIFLDNFAGQAYDRSAVVDYESESSLPYRGALTWTIAPSGTPSFSVLSGTSSSLSSLTTRLLIDQNGDVGIGTTLPAYTLDVAGVTRAHSGIVYPDGNKQTVAWTGVLCGGDYAESVDVAGSRTRYEPGDVIVIHSQTPEQFRKSSEPYSTLVAGIYSTKPGVVGERASDSNQSDAKIPMAMVGIVPTKVSAENGAVRAGDLLVTSSTPGYAMKSTDRRRIAGAIVGKALGNLDSGTGTIEVLVTLQ